MLVGESGPQTTAYLEIVETGDVPALDRVGAVEDADALGADLDLGRSVNVYGLVFDFDSATLLPDSTPTLEQVALLLSQRPDLRLNVVGHTDNQGSAGYNRALSERRARSVVDALVVLYGVAPGRLSASGEGMNRPISSNDTEEGRAQNRRVELVPM